MRINKLSKVSFIRGFFLLSLISLFTVFQNCTGSFKSVDQSITSSSQEDSTPTSLACGGTPNGGTQTQTMYTEELSPTCDGIERTRTCSNGAFTNWSGDNSYSFNSCAIEGMENMSCGNTPYGGFESRTFYENASVPYGEPCGTGVVQRRRCGDNGFEDWDGPLTNETCVVEEPGPFVCGERSPLQIGMQNLGTVVDKDQIARNFGDPEARFGSCPITTVPFNSYQPPARGTANFRNYIETWQVYANDIGRLADQYLIFMDEDSKQQAANCAIDMMYEISRRNIFEENGNTFVDPQGEYERFWLMGTLNIAYGKISGQAGLDPTKISDITRWLDVTATRVESYGDIMASNPDRLGSLVFGAGLTLMANGINLNDTQRFNTGLSYQRLGLDLIDQNGVIPKAMEDGQARAFQYHIFALSPLIYGAEVARINNVDLYSYNNGALQRLIELVVRSYDDFSVFENLAPVAQTYSPQGTLREDNPAILPGEYTSATPWMEIVFSRTGDQRLLPYIPGLRDNVEWKYGNVTISHGLPCLY